MAFSKYGYHSRPTLQYGTPSGISQSASDIMLLRQMKHGDIRTCCSINTSIRSMAVDLVLYVSRSKLMTDLSEVATNKNN